MPLSPEELKVIQEKEDARWAEVQTLAKQLEERMAKEPKLEPKNLIVHYGLEKAPCGAFYPEGWALPIKCGIDMLIEKKWDKNLQQMKTKFGGLRFYIGQATSDIYNMVTAIEYVCAYYCPGCGIKFESEESRVERPWGEDTCLACSTKYKPINYIGN